jgi:transposase
VWQSGGVKTLSLDLRERILTSYDRAEGTREAVAARYRVSLGMVKKLLQQRRRIGQIGPQHHRSGRKPMIVASHHRQLRGLLEGKPDLTLKELRTATGLACSLPAIHYVLAKLGLTYKKRLSERANKTAPTSRRHGGRGSAANPASIRPGWSSSTNRARRRT